VLLDEPTKFNTPLLTVVFPVTVRVFTKAAVPVLATRNVPVPDTVRSPPTFIEFAVALVASVNVPAPVRLKLPLIDGENPEASTHVVVAPPTNSRLW